VNKRGVIGLEFDEKNIIRDRVELQAKSTQFKFNSFNYRTKLARSRLARTNSELSHESELFHAAQTKSDISPLNYIN
jgi:hypothetical protein